MVIKSVKNMADDERLDPEDYKTLLNAVLRQAIDDYIKLQHPKFRNKKYLKEAFTSAVELFFDKEYRFLYLKNEYDEDLNLKDLIAHLLNDNRSDLTLLQNHVIEEARVFWETKLIRTIYLPDNFIYGGHVYAVHHTDSQEASIDYNKKIITLNKRNDSESEQEFIELAIGVCMHHEKKNMSQKEIEEIAKIVFRMLKINSCFTGS